jgi:regulator of sirC expression with transglutaminase-like and TPR domain
MEKDQISALINLLDDPDAVVYNAIFDKIVQLDQSVIPIIQSATKNNKNKLFLDRAELIVDIIRKKSLDNELKKWITQEKNDLIYGAYIIAKYRYPEITFQELDENLSQIIRELQHEINNYLTGLQQIRKINHVLFDIYRFTGDFSNIIDPRNSFVNKVIERKKSNDISLAILYLHISQKLGLPVYGIDFPGNFLLAFVDEKTKEAIFYINPFNKGTIVTGRDIDNFMKNHKIIYRENYFELCSNNAIIKRLLKFLMQSYLQKNDKENVKEIKRILTFFK